MGANCKQALGLTIFLIAFVLMAVSFAMGGSVLFLILALAGIGLASMILIKAKPLEHLEQ